MTFRREAETCEARHLQIRSADCPSQSGSIQEVTLGIGEVQRPRLDDAKIEQCERAEIAVDGDVITFSNSNLCDGIGTYQWSLEGDMLTLTLTGADPCSGRTDVLAAQTFVRSP